MLVTHPSPLYYAEATSWNETNFILPDEIRLIISEVLLPGVLLVDKKALACTCKKIHTVVILGRLNEYEKIKDLVFFRSDFNPLIKNTPLFDNSLKIKIENLSDIQKKYDKILKFLLKRNIFFYKNEKSYDKYTDSTLEENKCWHAPLFRWVALNNHDSVHKVFQFMLEFGFPVKNLAMRELNVPCIIFEELLNQKEKPMQLIGAGTRVDDCKKIVERVKTALRLRQEQNWGFQYKYMKKKQERINKLESYLEEFENRAQLEEEFENRAQLEFVPSDFTL